MEFLKTLIARSARAYVRAVPFERGKGRLIRFATRLAPTGYQRVVVRGLFMDLELEDLHQNIIFFRGLYEANTIDLIHRLLRPGDVAVDVGANIGLHTLQAARAVGPTGNVHAFEPMPDLCKRLEDHLRLNALDNVIINPIAISDVDKATRLYISAKANYGNHSFSAENAGMYSAGEPIGGFEVQCRELDGYLEDLEVTNVRLLKVDVEGAEYQVFKGAERLLDSANAPVIVFEASDFLSKPFGYLVRDVKSFLLAKGYSIYRFAKAGLQMVSIEESHRLEDLVAVKATQPMPGRLV